MASASVIGDSQVSIGGSSFGANTTGLMVDSPVVSGVNARPRRGIIRTVFGWAISAIIRCWQLFCLVILLSIAASIPVVQFASLGYILESAGRWARGQRFRECLPGLKQAGYIGTVSVWIGISSVPVLIVRDLSASASMINPGSGLARAWYVGSAVLWVMWVVYVWWAILRGGRVYHFLWPAPIRFLKQFFRPSTWQTAIDRLAEGLNQFRIFYLLKLGFLGSLGTLFYLAIPGGMMIAGVRSSNEGAVAIFTLVGIITMAITLQYLPFLQIRYAKTKQFRSFFDIRSVRQGFQRAPWLHAIATLMLVVFSLPLYLLRIEMPPAQLVWLLCIFFVLFNLPAKFLLAWAVRYADSRTKKRAFYNRYPAWLLLISSLPIYVLFLYLASLASWDGSSVMVIQHAFLTPVPFLLR